MKNFSRRDWLKSVAAGATALSTGDLLLNNIHAESRAHVIIVGGGFGGATCAHYIKSYAPNVKVTMIEPNTSFISCPLSNLVVAGMKKVSYITHQYRRLIYKHAVNIEHDWVTGIDASKETIALVSGRQIQYDFLVLSPGVDFRWDKITGYNEQLSTIFPHAWKAGEQTSLLHTQLEAMQDGGRVVISVPKKPYKAPPAPYERASLIADYLLNNKPKSKILLLDPNSTNANLALFKQEWQKRYEGMIELVTGKDAFITELDAKNKVAISETGTKYIADVLNIIPPQYSAKIIRQSGLANSAGWCDVDAKSFRSKLDKNIYIIGDSCDAGDMPKLAHAANSQAKSCAVAIVSAINNVVAPDSILNTSVYSFTSARTAISEVGIYRIKDDEIVRVSGGVSDINATKKYRYKESKYAFAWYRGIIRDMLGS